MIAAPIAIVVRPASRSFSCSYASRLRWLRCHSPLRSKRTRGGEHGQPEPLDIETTPPTQQFAPVVSSDERVVFFSADEGVVYRAVRDADGRYSSAAPAADINGGHSIRVRSRPTTASSISIPIAREARASISGLLAPPRRKTQSGASSIDRTVFCIARSAADVVMNPERGRSKSNATPKTTLISSATTIHAVADRLRRVPAE